MSLRGKIPLILAASYGGIYIFIAVYFWGIYAVSYPTGNWLLEGLSGKLGELGYLIAIYLHDLVINILLALPFAFLISRLRPASALKYLLIAVTVALLLSYWQILLDWSTLYLLAGSPSFYFGIVMTMISLPLAYVVVAGFRRGDSAPSQRLQQTKE